MKKVALTLALLAAAILVIGCGGGGTDSGASSDAASTGSDQSYPLLRWGSNPINRLDFTTNLETNSAAMEALAVENLMEFEPDGKVKPNLAESVDHPDPTTYVYHVRKGVKFSDGKPLTAADVVYSLERNLGKESQTASSYASVASITEKDPMTVVVKLKQPNVVWPQIVAYAGQIIEKAAAEKVGEDKIGTPQGLPIGTGPWKVDSFDPSTGVTFSINPEWRGAKQPAEKIDVSFFKDESATALAMRSGQIDGAPSVMVPKSFESIPGVHLLSVPGTGSSVISMNTIVAPFNDIHVRRAIAYATDVEGMEAATQGEFATRSHSVLPASVLTGLAPAKKVEAMLESLPKYEFDLEAAKRELAKSKYPDGFTTTAQVEPNNNNGTVVGQILAADLAKIGIKLKVDVMPSSTWLATLYGPRDAIKVMPVQYASPFPDPNALMEYWLSPASATVNGLNSANYKNPEVGKLLEQETMTEDPEKRFDLIARILRISMEDVPYQPQYASDIVSPLSDKYVWVDHTAATAWSTAWAMGVKLAE